MFGCVTAVMLTIIGQQIDRCSCVLDADVKYTPIGSNNPQPGTRTGDQSGPGTGERSSPNRPIRILPAQPQQVQALRCWLASAVQAAALRPC